MNFNSWLRQRQRQAERSSKPLNRSREIARRKRQIESGTLKPNHHAQQEQDA